MQSRHEVKPILLFVTSVSMKPSWDLVATHHSEHSALTIYIRYNGGDIDESQQVSFYDAAATNSTLYEQGRRRVNMELELADNLELLCDSCRAGILQSTLCVSLLQAV